MKTNQEPSGSGSSSQFSRCLDPHHFLNHTTSTVYSLFLSEYFKGLSFSNEEGLTFLKRALHSANDFAARLPGSTLYEFLIGAMNQGD